MKKRLSFKKFELRKLKMDSKFGIDNSITGLIFSQKHGVFSKIRALKYGENITFES